MAKNGRSPGSDPTGHQPPTRRDRRILRAGGLALIGLSTMLGGCATTTKSLEKVAKDWCETIRASQVICVYPLTEDLAPGDVFLVQIPVGEEQKLYREKGFLPLGDHRKRLHLSKQDYQSFYANGYWEDEFGAKVPNKRAKREGAGPVGDKTKPALTEINAPRAVFPSYTFKVENRAGLGLAIPVKGIPVGLSYMQADRADGSLVIGDARSYGVDSMLAYGRLRSWLEQDPSARLEIRGTVRQSNVDFLLLRVITRVYLSGGMVVSLTRDDTRGGELSVGKAPEVPLTTATGEINKNVESTLSALDALANRDLLQAGGAVKFVSASGSSVTLAESFDRMLAVGYVAVDVPFYKDGNLGYPLPTFERLERIAGAPPSLAAGDVSPPQRQHRVNQAALEALAQQNPRAAVAVMDDVVNQLKVKELDAVRPALDAARANPDPPGVKEAVKDFDLSAARYVGVTGDWGQRYERFAEAFAAAYERHVKQGR